MLTTGGVAMVVAMVMAAALLLGCGEEAPSCEQAVDHFYDSDCAFFNRQTGTPYSRAEITSLCKELLADAPDQCGDELADLRSCWGSVRSPATSDADCDCSEEQDALLTCD